MLPAIGTAPFSTTPLKAVRVSVPSGVVIAIGVVPSACSCAAVTTVPPIVTDRNPSAAATAMVPVLRSLVSGPPGPSTSPCSSTSVCPVAAPLPSTGTIDGPPAPSVWPWMVMVSVVGDVFPSPSVML